MFRRVRSEAQALDSKQKTTALGLTLDSLSDRQKSSRHPVCENLILIFYVLIIFSGKRNKISLPEAVKYIIHPIVLPKIFSVWIETDVQY